MQTVTVYGHGDDCIEVDGAIPGCDEYSAYRAPKYLHFGDGSVLRVEYAPRDAPHYFWRIGVVKAGKGTKIEYSPWYFPGSQTGTRCDKVVLTGNLGSVRCYGSADGPTREEMLERLEDTDWTVRSDGALRTAFEATFSDDHR